MRIQLEEMGGFTKIFPVMWIILLGGMMSTKNILIQVFFFPLGANPKPGKVLSLITKTFLYKEKDPQYLIGFQSRQPELLPLISLVACFHWPESCTSCVLSHSRINRKSIDMKTSWYYFFSFAVFQLKLDSK